MKIYQKYIIKEFFVVFAYAIVSFIIILLSTEMFENLRMLIEYNTPIKIALKYYLFRIPYLLIQVLPITTFLATLYTITKLIKTNELTALITNGISTRKLGLPFILAATAISIFNLTLDETIVPDTNVKAREIKQRNIKKIKPILRITKHNMIFISDKNQIIYAKEFNSENALMKDVSIIKLDNNNNITERTEANEGVFIKDHWELKNGNIRKFNGDKEEVVNFTKLKTIVKNSPSDFVKPFRSVKYELNMIDSLKYINKLKKRGSKFVEELVYFYFKTSFPFANLVLALFGIPFALIVGKNLGTISCFGFSIMFGFIYWTIMALGSSLGKYGVIPPALAAWLGNIVFAIIGILLLYIENKAHIRV